MTPRDDESYASRETLRQDLLDDEEFRYGYAESYLNSYVAAQLKALREQRGMTQADLAEAIGTKQTGVSRLENVNYSAWKTETLRRIARALKVRLSITFETFGTLLDEVERFKRESLERKLPGEDPILNSVTPMSVGIATSDGSPRNSVVKAASTATSVTPGDPGVSSTDAITWPVVPRQTQTSVEQQELVPPVPMLERLGGGFTRSATHVSQ